MNETRDLRDVKKWFDQAGTCEACNESPPHPSWRWNGEEWEHKCPGKKPQAAASSEQDDEDDPGDLQADLISSRGF